MPRTWAPVPAPRRIRVKIAPMPFPSDPAGRLDLILALGWSKQPRVRIERAAQPGPAPFAPAPTVDERDELVRRARADGFVYMPRLLAADHLDPLRAVIDRALVRRGWRIDGRSDPALRLGRWDDAQWIEFLAEVIASAAYRDLAAA